MDMINFLSGLGANDEIAVKIALFCQRYNLTMEKYLLLVCNDAIIKYGTDGEEDIDFNLYMYENGNDYVVEDEELEFY